MFDNTKKQQMANVVSGIPENTMDIWTQIADYKKIPAILAKPVEDWTQTESAIVMGIFVRVVGTENLWNDEVQTYTDGLALNR